MARRPAGGPAAQQPARCLRGGPRTSSLGLGCRVGASSILRSAARKVSTAASCRQPPHASRPVKGRRSFRPAAGPLSGCRPPEDAAARRTGTGSASTGLGLADRALLQGSGGPVSSPQSSAGPQRHASAAKLPRIASVRVGCCERWALCCYRPPQARASLRSREAVTGGSGLLSESPALCRASNPRSLTISQCGMQASNALPLKHGLRVSRAGLRWPQQLQEARSGSLRGQRAAHVRESCTPVDQFGIKYPETCTSCCLACAGRASAAARPGAPTQQQTCHGRGSSTAPRPWSRCSS